MATQTYTTQLAVTSCGSCHIPFAWPVNADREAREDGSWFYCPNGHRVHYTQSDNARLTAQLDQAKADARWQRDRRTVAERAAEHERNRAAAFKGHLTRLRRRVANGVCPAPGCKRSFSNVQAHVASEHPGWLAEHAGVFDA